MKNVYAVKMKKNEGGREPGIRKIRNTGTVKPYGPRKTGKSKDSDQNHLSRKTVDNLSKSPGLDSQQDRKKVTKGVRKETEFRNNRSESYGKGNRKFTSYKRDSSRTERTVKGSPGRKTPANSDEIRLNRYIAHSGICSRRQADEFIKAGLVSVNGQVIKEMGVKVKPADIVKYNGETIRSEKKVYLLLNKPKDYVTSLDDDQRRKTVMDLIRDACPERVYPVGRLDRNTTGVMLFTNDGELSAKLAHPKYNKKKVYHASLDKNLKKDDMQSIAQGITLEDGFVAPDAISYIEGGKKSEIGIEIHSGRNRIVRRIFEHFGYRIIKLDRVYFAGLTKKNIQRGKWRFLTEKEIYTLKMNSYE